MGSLLAMAGCGWFSKSDPKSSAEAFFEMLRIGNTSAAYDSASFVFQAQQNLQRFEITVKNLGLADFQSIDWTHSVIKDNEAKFDAKITTKSGKKASVVAVLIKDSGRWKIYTLHTSSTNSEIPVENQFSVVGRSPELNQVFKQSLPDENQISELVRETLAKFNAGILQKNFADFYEYVSIALQSRHTQKALDRAFAEFLDKGADIGAAKKADIVFDEPPLINNEGLLEVNGHFKSPSGRVIFALKYTYELPKWKLYGIEIKFEK